VNGADLALASSTIDFILAAAVLSLSSYVTMSAGMLSFATVGFGAIGGYCGARLMQNTSIPLVLVVVIVALAGAVSSALVAPALLRLKSHWFALASLALMLVVNEIATNGGSVTGGTVGITVPAGITVWWGVGCLAAIVLIIWRLEQTKYGIATTATREDPVLAGAMGINTWRIQFWAFVVAGGIAGVGGLLEAGFLQYIEPNTYYITLAVAVVAAVVLGGTYSWFGVVIGAAIFTALPVIIQQYFVQGDEIVNGVLLILVMIYVPGGIIDPVRRRRKLYRKKRNTNVIEDNDNVESIVAIEREVVR